MINQLKILHRTAEEDLKIPETGLIEWKTCLRSISFHSGNLPSTHTGTQAYEFLLQVICGLKSPMIGETEILAQFKGFLKRNPEVISRKISEKLIQDSKKIRTKYLKNYGSQSYGSYTLKKSKSLESIVLLGAGALTQDIVPIIKDHPGDIIVMARNLDKAKASFKKYPHVKIKSIDDEIFYTKSLIVVAAPLESEALEELIFKNFDQSSVLDMRSNRDGPHLKLGSRFLYKSLDEIFKEIETTQERLKEICHEIEAEIKELSNKWNQKAWNRPFGWEDLCY
ncbi:MAG: glutamyl-tRNA reductase [Bacteriovoracaceae bacterium]